MLVPGRNASSSNYRYGYQGSEKDDEIKGEGNSYTTHYRQLDVRINRWLTRDPKPTAFETPYSSMSDNTILYNDKLGVTVKIKNGSRTLAYDKGKLVEINKNGKIAGSGKAFFRKVEKMLSGINSVDKGAQLINMLRESKYTHTIEYMQGKSNSIPTTSGKFNMMEEVNNATYYENEFLEESRLNDDDSGRLAPPAIGVNTTVFFDHNISYQINANKGLKKNGAMYVLAHELFHLAESNYGILTFEAEQIGVIREFRAIHFENLLRKSLNVTHKRINGVVNKPDV